MAADRFRYYLNMQSLTLQHVMSLWHVPNTILHTAIFIGPSPFTVYTAMFQSHQLLVLYVCFFRKLPNLYSLILQHLSWMIFYLLLFYHYNLFVLYPLVLNKLNLTMLILNSPCGLIQQGVYITLPGYNIRCNGAVTSCLLFPPRYEHSRGSNSGAGSVNVDVNVDGLRKLK